MKKKIVSGIMIFSVLFALNGMGSGKQVLAADENDAKDGAPIAVEDAAGDNEGILDDETNWQNDEEDIVEVDETAEVNGTDTLDGDIQLFADDPKDESDGVPDGYTGFWKDPETGDWYYCINGSIDISTTDVIQGVVDGKSGWWNVVDGKVTEGETVAHNSNGWWYINSDGMVDFSYKGFAHNSNGWWYLENGKVTFDKNSVIQGTVNETYSWWYVIGSKVQTDFTGLADYSNSNGWWYINNGEVTFDVETVAQNKNGVWYVKDSKVDFSYNGFAQDDNDDWWYIEDGAVTYNKNSVIQDTNKKIDDTAGWWYVVGSQVQTDFTGLADYSNVNGWWYISNGKVDFNVETVAQNKNGWWYVKDSKVIFSYNGFAENENGCWYIEDGTVTFNKNSVIQDTNKKVDDTAGWWYVLGSKVQKDFTGLADYSNANGWWYINDGKVTFDVETVAQNKNGWWYVKDSKVIFSYNGFAQNSNGWWYIESGQVTFNKNSVIQGTVDGTNAWWYVVGSKVRTDFTGLADYSNANGWWYINEGKVTFNVNTVAQNKNGWWYVKDSKVDFSYTGSAQNENGWWYISGGQVDFNTGTVVQEGSDWVYYYNGKRNTSYCGVAPNENGWWYVYNGKVVFDDVMTYAAQFVGKNTKTSQSDSSKLSSCFQVLWSTYSYKRYYETPSASAMTQYALDMFINKEGNCYRYAASFACIAKALGYEARVGVGQISAVGGGMTPHGWTEVKDNGTWYICDANMQRNYPGINSYMRTESNYAYTHTCSARYTLTTSSSGASWN